MCINGCNVYLVYMAQLSSRFNGVRRHQSGIRWHVPQFALPDALAGKLRRHCLRLGQTSFRLLAVMSCVTRTRTSIGCEGAVRSCGLFDLFMS